MSLLLRRFIFTLSLYMMKPIACVIFGRPQLLYHRFLKQWDKEALLEYLQARGTTWDTFKKAYRLGDGTNGLPEATMSSGNYFGTVIVTFEMNMYGPNLAEAPPQDEQVRFMAFPLAI